MLGCSEKTVTVYDKINELINISPYATYNFGDLETARTCFDDGGLFMNFHMFHMMEVASTYQSDVGIVPCPKYSEEQTEYYSRAGYNGATAVTILSSVPDPERAGIVLEIFARGTNELYLPCILQKALHRPLYQR